MKQFNFSVKAIDTDGSHSERAFSINVRDTSKNRFVITTAAQSMTSVDGITWKTVPATGGNASVFHKGKWIIGHSGGIRYSTDGFNYTNLARTGIQFVDFDTKEPVTVPAINAASWVWMSDLVSCKEYVCALIGVGTSSYFIRSKDAITWEYEPTSPHIHFNSLVPSNGDWKMKYDEYSDTLVIGYKGVNSTTYGFYSNNEGTDWTRLVGLSSMIPNTVTRVNGYFYAFPQNSWSGGVYSYNGVDWYGMAMQGTSAHMRAADVKYINGRYIILCEKYTTSNSTTATVVLYSDNGTSFTLATGTPTFNISGSGTYLTKSGVYDGRLWVTAALATGCRYPVYTEVGSNWVAPSTSNIGVITSFSVFDN